MRIDAHAHLMPPAALDAPPVGLRPWATAVPDEAGVTVDGRAWRGRGAAAALRSLEAQRAFQTEHAIDLSVLAPWVDMVKGPREPALQARWCAVINGALGAAVAGAPEFAWLAALPDLDGGAAAAALEEAVAAGAVGAMLAATSDAGTLARPALDPLWAAAERLGAPLFVHPGEYEPAPQLRAGFMVNLVGNPADTTLAAATLLQADVPSRFPSLQVILAHGGGFLPWQAHRIATGFARRAELEGVSRLAPEDFLRWFLYDTVLFDADACARLIDRVGDDRVLAGTDAPFLMRDAIPFAAPESLGLGAEALARVLGGNAVRVFGLHDRQRSHCTTDLD
ncbi:amidohydrolase family protein [Conexibacter stalactiti]|uniref:Amidohydrolase family protein n=1 Tax=Conexibacter stalactiti TaxID=1940611 RepID=A0ABU4HL89_9ACTN|nr:amidohydrolase family protein [Conexibacter stalactiti]MDW5594053.1 amidohydrolase family protein [Conexibacter stalactiti]MEC5034695.1 amidohydrolase family protein [Conexibacter stalactiti]